MLLLFGCIFQSTRLWIECIQVGKFSIFPWQRASCSVQVVCPVAITVDQVEKCCGQMFQTIQYYIYKKNCRSSRHFCSYIHSLRYELESIRTTVCSCERLICPWFRLNVNLMTSSMNVIVHFDEIPEITRVQCNLFLLCFISVISLFSVGTK